MNRLRPSQSVTLREDGVYWTVEYDRRLPLGRGLAWAALGAGLAALLAGWGYGAPAAGLAVGGCLSGGALLALSRASAGGCRGVVRRQSLAVPRQPES